MYSSPVVRPAPYAGVVEECNRFLLQCSLAIHTQPQLYPSEQCKITFVISSLTGPALLWAETIWSQAGPATQSFENFITHFREVFGTTKGDSSIGEQLYHLKQGNMTMHEYTLQFRTLAAASGWNEASLITALRRGLEPRLRLQLASFDDSQGLESFIQQATRCSNHLQSCPKEFSPASLTPRYHQTDTQNPPETHPEPMQTDINRLTPTEHRRRMTQGLCLYCGTGGHHFMACPLRPP